MMLGAAMLLSGHGSHFPDAQSVLVAISENMHIPTSLAQHGTRKVIVWTAKYYLFI